MLSDDVTRAIGAVVLAEADPAIACREAKGLRTPDLRAIASEWLQEQARAEIRDATRRAEQASAARAESRAAESGKASHRLAMRQLAPTIGLSPDDDPDLVWAMIKKDEEERRAACIESGEPERLKRLEDEVHEARQGAIWTSMYESVERFKVAAIAEFTDELLASKFAMPDGTFVSWGDASIDQHRERLSMFTANAAANVEGAARHALAIEKIEQAGVACLSDLAPATDSCRPDGEDQ